MKRLRFSMNSTNSLIFPNLGLINPFKMKKLIVLLIPVFFVLSSCKKEYAVERSIIIDAPQDVVWQHVKYFKNWSAWSPWYAKDSTMAWIFSGTDGELESAYAWTSEESGSGEMTNTGLTEGEELIYHTHFLEPWESESAGYVRLRTVDGGTEVKWGFSGEVKGIASLFLNMDKMIGPDFEAGLALLKTHAEKEAKKVPKFIVETIDFAAHQYLGIRAEIAIVAIETFFGTTFDKIMKSGVKMEGGSPTGLYYTWDMENMKADMAVAIPVAKGTIAPEGTKLIELPAGKALLINYYGPYEHIGTAHDLMETYLLSNNLAFTGPAIEEYVTDPKTESDPNKWLTKVIYPIK